MHVRRGSSPAFAVQIRPIEPILTAFGVESADRSSYHAPPYATRHQEGQEPNKLPHKRLK